MLIVRLHDPFVRNAEAMLIKDEKMQEMFLAQLKAWTGVMPLNFLSWINA